MINLLKRKGHMRDCPAMQNNNNNDHLNFKFYFNLHIYLVRKDFIKYFIDLLQIFVEYNFIMGAAWYAEDNI